MKGFISLLSLHVFKNGHNCNFITVISGKYREFFVHWVEIAFKEVLGISEGSHINTSNASE